MGKKIVVITGSPRKSGNSFAMTDAFVEAAEKLGHTVTRFDAAMKQLGGCHACETCFKTGKACSFDDDFNTIAPAILEADAVIFTMPVYWYSIPAQIKCVIDKLFSFCVAGKDIAGKGCGLIACCEEDDMAVFDAVKLHHNAHIRTPGNCLGGSCVRNHSKSGEAVTAPPLLLCLSPCVAPPPNHSRRPR